jgi:hypothetical protein
LPFELQFGLSKQLSHAPFRFSFLYQHLQDFNLDGKRSGDSESLDDKSFSRRIEDMGNEFLRHIVAGVEFIPVRSFSVNAGYNNLRRHELKIDEMASTVGFSWGFSLQVTMFRVSFGRTRYHLAGSSSHFSVTTNLASFYGR